MKELISVVDVTHGDKSLCSINYRIGSEWCNKTCDGDISFSQDLDGDRVIKSDICVPYQGYKIFVGDERSYYVKRVIDSYYKGEDIDIEGLKQEIEVYEKVNHPNIACYHGCIVRNGLVEGIVSSKYTKRLSEYVPDNEIRVIMQLEDVVQYLHSKGIVHGDINPYNIMFDEKDNLVLIDFDSVGKNSKKQGTGEYMSSSYSKETASEV